MYIWLTALHLAGLLINYCQLHLTEGTEERMNSSFLAVGNAKLFALHQGHLLAQPVLQAPAPQTVTHVHVHAVSLKGTGLRGSYM